METFLKIVAQANTSEILSISSDEITRKLNVCQTIQEVFIEIVDFILLALFREIIKRIRINHKT